MSQLFASGGQRIGASASVLPMNFQGWFLYTWYFFDTCNWDLGDQWWGRRQLYSCMFVLKLPWFLGVPQIYIQGLSWWLKTTQNKTEQKNPACQWRRHKKCEFDSWVGKIPWRRKWQPTPVFLPGQSHGQRNLAGYSPWGHKESDMTEVT